MCITQPDPTIFSKVGTPDILATTTFKYKEEAPLNRISILDFDRRTHNEVDYFVTIFNLFGSVKFSFQTF